MSDTENEDLTLDELEVKAEDLEDQEVDDQEDSEDVDESTGEEDDLATPASIDLSQQDLSAKLKELEASNAGLIKSLSAQRNLRQDLQGQLDGIKEALNEVRSRSAAVNTEIKQGPSVIPVDFDDEGNPFLDPSLLSSVQFDELTAIKNELMALKNSVNATVAHTTEQQNLNKILAEKDGYKTAYKQVTAAWNYLKDDIFDDYITKAGLNPPKTADEAINIALQSAEIKSKFAAKFPSVDLESVLEAHLIATPRYLRKALDKAVVTDSKSNETLDFNKPSSLINANSSGGANYTALLKRVADMSNEEYAALDDRTRKKIDLLLEKKG